MDEIIDCLGPPSVTIVVRSLEETNSIHRGGGKDGDMPEAIQPKSLCHVQSLEKDFCEGKDQKLESLMASTNRSAAFPSPNVMSVEKCRAQVNCKN